MAIKRTDVILAAGIHQIGHRAGAPTPLQNLRDGEFSLHHILPYRYPLAVGFLVEAFGRAFFGGRAQWLNEAGAAKETVVDRAKRILQVVSRFGSAQHDIPAKFAWMGPNLFQGPSGNFRLDDPGSGRETLKPQSYREDRWDSLQRIGDALDAKGALGSSPQGYSFTNSQAITVGDLEDLLKLFMPLAEANHGNAHTFQATDWLVMSPTEPQGGFRCFQVGGVVTTPDKVRFAHLEAIRPGKINRYQPGDLAIGPTNPIPFVWRLWKQGDPINLPTIDAVRLQ